MRKHKKQKLDADRQASNQLRRIVMEAVGHCTVGDTDRAIDCLDELCSLIDADIRAEEKRHA